MANQYQLDPLPLDPLPKEVIHRRSGPSMLDPLPGSALDDFESAPQAPGPNATPEQQQDYRIARKNYDLASRNRGRAVGRAQREVQANSAAYDAAHSGDAVKQLDDETKYFKMGRSGVIQEQRDEAAANPDADTMDERIRKSIIQNWSGFKQQAAGLERFGAEHAADLAGKIIPGLAPLAQAAKPLVDEATQPIVHASEAVYKAAQADIDDNGYKFAGKTDEYGQNIVDSLVQMVPTVAAAYLTRGESAAAETEAAGAEAAASKNPLVRFMAKYRDELKEQAPSLGVLGAQQGAQQYGQSRANGRTVGQSDMDSAVFSLAEALPEAMPLGVAMKQGGHLLPRLLKTAALEAPGEMLTQAVEDGYSKGVLNEQMTWGEALQHMVDAGIVGFGMGLGMGGAGHAMHEARGGDAGATIRAMQDAQFDTSGAATHLLDPQRDGILPVARVPTAKGAVEAAIEQSQETPEDRASPLSAVVNLGAAKTALAGAHGQMAADKILDRNSAPPTGTMVELHGKRWTVDDAFTDEHGEDGVTLARNGQKQKVYFSDLSDAGLSLTAIADPRQQSPLDAAVSQAAPGTALPGAEPALDRLGTAPAAPTPTSGKAEFMRRIRHAENATGNPNAKNPNSSASGIYQFTDPTFDAYYRKVYGTEPPAGVKNNPEVQQNLMDAMTGDNEKALTKAGFDATAGHLYLAHFAGPRGAINLLRNPNGSAAAILGPRATASNKSIVEGKTGAEVIAWANRKMGENSSPSSLGTAHFVDGTPAEPQSDDGFDFLHQPQEPDTPPESPAIPEHQDQALIQPEAAPTMTPQEEKAKQAEIDAAAARAVEPTEAQAEAGNYRKGHVNLHGIDITIETPKGATRSGTAPDGSKWSVEMPDHYGYAKRTTGADGEQVDVYVGPKHSSNMVYVVDQHDHETGLFDEHKAMLGYSSQGEALDAYHRAFSDGKGPDRVGHVTPMTVDQFKGWLSTEQTAPAKETAPESSAIPAEPRVIDFEQYAAQNGASRQGYGDAGMHSPAGDVGRNTRNAQLARIAAESDALSARRADLQKEYDAAVERGEIRPLTSTERLERTAAGSPDNLSTQAAQRVLAKREARVTESVTPKESPAIPTQPESSVGETRSFFRGIPEGVADQFQVHQRGPLGAGVYLTGNESNAKRYGAQVIEAETGANILDGVRGKVTPEFEQSVIGQMTPEERTRFARWKTPSDMGSFVDQVTRAAESDRIPKIFGALGYDGIESNVDGHEVVVFDPAKLKAKGAAAASPAAFDPEKHVDNLRSYIASSKGSLNDIDRIAKHLGLPAEQAHAVMGAVASRPNAGFRMTPGKPAVTRKVEAGGGRTRTVTVRKAVPPRYIRDSKSEVPLSTMAFVRSLGGIHDPRHDLRNVGALRNHPGVLSKKGRPVDEIGRALHEDGRFPNKDPSNPDQRPTVDETIQFLADESQRRGKVEASQPSEEDARAAAADELKAAIRDSGGLLPSVISNADRDAIVDDMLASGEDAASAAYAHFERQFVEALATGREETGSTDYDIPFDLGATDEAPTEQSRDGSRAETGETGDRPESQPADAGAGEEARADSGQDGGQEGQLDAFGQRQDDQRTALEREGEGRLKGNKPQKAPGSDGGLFDTQDKTGDLFDAKPKAETKPSGIPRGRPGMMVGKGEVYLTASGRETTPVPNVEAHTDRQSANAAKRLDGWLIENARAEAKARGDDFNGPMFDRMEPKKLSPSDMDTLNEYLFGDEQPQVIPSPLKDLVRPATPIGQAKAALQQAMAALDAAEKPAEMIQDAGEKIGGARKDRWKERGMIASDLEGMSEGEAFELVTKDAVWPKPDYEKMVADGVPADVAAGVKIIRDRLAAKPRVDSQQGRRDYVEMMGMARRILSAARTITDLDAAQSNLYAAAGDTGGYSRTPEQKANQAKLFSIFKGRTADFRLDYSEKRKAAKMVEEGFPAKAEPWRRQYEARETQKGWMARVKGGEYFGGPFETKAEAEAAAKARYESQDRTRDEPIRPHLDNLTRTGEDVRGGRDIDSTDFIKDFGFRGVEFGNWVASDERQKSTNLAYEALHDLASTLGIPPRALSLGGQLGIAFGARGSGHAAAHYEPGKLVINLTKLSGAGTLAHEWGHALDHYFGTLDTDIGTRGAPTYASGGRDHSQINKSRIVALGNLRPEMARAFDGLMDSLFRSEVPRADAIRDVELRIEKLKAGIDTQRARLAENQTKLDAEPKGQGASTYKKFAKESTDWIAFQEQRLARNEAVLEDLRDESKPYEGAKRTSNYLEKSQRLSKSSPNNYWTRPTEMLARSFEAYVYDKIKAQGNASTYLVHGVDPAESFAARAYPIGAERDAINAAYDDLFRTMQVDESGADPKLYSLSGSGEEIFYSALERAVEANPTTRAPAAQWAATLGKTPGVKREELEWSGVFDWLEMQKGPVDKQALLGVIRDGGIKVEEVVLGDDKSSEIEARAQQLYEEALQDERDQWDSRYGDSFDSGVAVEEGEDDDGNPVWTVNGEEFADEGEAYDRQNELENEARDEAADDYAQNSNINYAQLEAQARDELRPETQFQDWSSDPSNESYRELLITLPRGQGGNPSRAPSTHWDTDAVVAHARLMEKRDAEGNRVLFIEEVQSDWHQKGRDQGYDTNPASAEEIEAARAALTEADAAVAEQTERVYAFVTERAHEAWEAAPDNDAKRRALDYIERVLDFGPGGLANRFLAQNPVPGAQEEADAVHDAFNRASLRAQEARQALNNKTSPKGIPEAPFKATWPALVMKRMIRYGVDNGFDKIAWTTGAEQAERYNLGAAVGEINAWRNRDGIYQVKVGNMVAYGKLLEEGLAEVDADSHRLAMTADQLKQAFGADIADKIVAHGEAHPNPSESGASITLNGSDLNVGGSGMRQFYDRNLVNITNDLVKKYGAKVEKMDIVDGREIVDTSEDAELNDIRARLATVRREHQALTRTLADEGLSGSNLREDPRYSEVDRRLTTLLNEESARKQTVIAKINDGRANPGLTLTPALKEVAAGGFPLFQNGEANITPENVAQVQQHLRTTMERLGIADRVLLRVVDRMADDPRAHGSYWRRVITVALSSPNAVHTINHEAIHALRALNVILPDEWTALVKAARADTALWSSIKQRYAGRNLNTLQMEEEAVADLFGNWSAKRASKGFIGRAFQRITDLLKSLAAAFDRMATGNRQPGQIFRDIESGKVGRRDTGAAARARVPSMPEEVSGPLYSIATEEPEKDVTLTGLMNRTQAATGELKTATTADQVSMIVDDMRTALQDRMLPMLRTEAAVEKIIGRELTDAEKPYLQEELMSGRTGAALEHLTDKLVEPLFDTMREEKVTVPELETYLYARHAPERNARISKINPEFSEGEGSGMTDIEAAAIMARIAKSGRMEALEKVAAQVDAIRDWQLAYRVETGLMSQKQADEWKAIYKNYAPLRGYAESAERPSDSRGISVRGKESQRAFGRRSRAEDLLAHTIMQAEEAIVRGQKNLVGQAFYRLAKDAKDDSFWKLHKVRVEKFVNPETGLVENRIITGLSPGDEAFTVFLKANGEAKSVTMDRNNPAAKRLASAMRRLDDTKMNGLVKFGSAVNRFLSAVNTSLNPEFVITNAFRDFQTATANLAGVNVKGIEAGVIKDYIPAMKAALQGSYGKESGDWGKWWNEFADNGGRVYYNQIRDIPELRKDIEKRMAEMARKLDPKLSPAELARRAKGIITGAYGHIEKVNLGVENAIRLATYKQARERGMSPDQAASLAKNITVNFNRRGSWGVAMNAFYLFYNASVQGSARILMAMKHKRVRRLMYGMVLSGLMLDMLNRAISGDDDDGESYYDKISDFEKSRNLIVMMKGGRYLKIPLPYGYNVFYSLGRSMSELAHGKRFGTVFGNLAVTALDAFNPIGGSDGLANVIAPTMLDPVVDLAVDNRDFAGRPIMPDQPQYGPPVPNNQRYWNSVSPHSKMVTDWLNTASGGDKVIPGKIDISPEVIDYLGATMFGAMGAFALRSSAMVEKTGQLAAGNPDVEFDKNDFPLVRKLIGDKPAYYDKAAFYTRITQVEEAKHRLKQYRENGDREGMMRFRQEDADLLHAARGAKQARKEIRVLRKERRAIDKAKELGRIDAATYTAKAKLLKDRETRVVSAFNRLYLATVKDPVGPD